MCAHLRCTACFTTSRTFARHSTYSLQQLRELPLRYYVMCDGVALIDARQPLSVNPTAGGLPKRKFQAEQQPATVAKAGAESARLSRYCCSGQKPNAF